ncbi:MAG TPA: carbonic anhydrase [Miltoncostaea sp.]|nr:carbonic anhydrase [Miltoncostaea sp.]
MPISAVDDILARATCDPSPLPPHPALHLAIVTCMDARIDPYAVFGLKPGEAHIIRNAGGLVSPYTLRSLALSQRALGTREVLVAQHTDCGVHGLDDERLAAEITAEVGFPPAWRGGGFADLEDTLRASIRRLRAAPELPHRDAVRGAIIDLVSGGVRPVDA